MFRLLFTLEKNAVCYPGFYLLQFTDLKTKVGLLQNDVVTLGMTVERRGKHKYGGK